jgi:hypothetical protein
MTTRGRKQHREPWREVLVDELSDENEDERRDFVDPQRDPFESEHGPTMGHDGDDNPRYAGPKSASVGASDTDKRFDADKIDPTTFHANDPVQRRSPLRVDVHNAEMSELALAANRPGQMVEDGHGFIVNNPRSRSWKTAKRTHCAHCGGPMPRPKVAQYVCEFDPDATELELSLIGSGQGSDDRAWWPGTRRSPSYQPGCQCSGCILRHLVSNGEERNRGQPRRVCSDECGKLRGNELKRWKAAVKRAQKRGDEPPPEPQDNGLKFVQRNGPRSSVEGSGHRYIAAAGLPWAAPRA